ncbi:MAG: NAD(P)/FAD-dependent oxidoreductase [Elusimicrobia bacterium]|nr:NAD(P)/FAD-dependent oxidoreductase [Elusimicrobiota bacterium]
MAEKKTILVLGGGVGGQTAANALAARLGRGHRIVLVERETDFSFSPSFLWIVTGERTPARICKPVAALLRPEVELIRADVAAVRPSERFVETSAGRLEFDFLIISLGADLAPGKVPGFEEAALNLYTLDGASKIGKRLRTFASGRIAVLICSSPFKCPAAPYEAAFLVKDLLAKSGAKAEVSVFTPEPFPMPTAGPEVGGALKAMLEARGITFHPNRKIARVDAQAKTLCFEDGSSAGFDLLIGVPPHQAAKAAKESGLANEAGWIPVDRATMATKQSRVYAIGDAAAIALAGGKSMPKAGVIAHAQAEIVADNVAAQCEGRNPDAAFDGEGWCAIELGAGSAAFGSGAFYVDPPQMRLYEPSVAWHWGKVLFERWWLAPFGRRRGALALAMRLGGRLKGIKVRL